jgi:hypothetical protein
MFAPMLEACPGFVPKWEEFVAEWQHNSDGLPLYLALYELANYLTGRIEAGEAKSLKSAFKVIERWLSEGDDYVRLAASVGLLERVKHAMGAKDPVRNNFKALLGPIAKEEWKLRV